MADEEEGAAEEARTFTTTPEELVDAIRTGSFADAAALVETTDLAALTASGETSLVACAFRSLARAEQGADQAPVPAVGRDPLLQGARLCR